MKLQPRLLSSEAASVLLILVHSALREWTELTIRTVQVVLNWAWLGEMTHGGQVGFC